MTSSDPQPSLNVPTSEAVDCDCNAEGNCRPPNRSVKCVMHTHECKLQLRTVGQAPGSTTSSETMGNIQRVFSKTCRCHVAGTSAVENTDLRSLTEAARTPHGKAEAHMKEHFKQSNQSSNNTHMRTRSKASDEVAITRGVQKN